jgi:hypothetical protein
MRFITEVSIRKRRRALAGRLVLRGARTRLDRVALQSEMVGAALEVRSAGTNLLEDGRPLETVEVGGERKKAETSGSRVREGDRCGRRQEVSSLKSFLNSCNDRGYSWRIAPDPTPWGLWSQPDKH